jgi:hypothetical protein
MMPSVWLLLAILLAAPAAGAEQVRVDFTSPAGLELWSHPGSDIRPGSAEELRSPWSHLWTREMPLRAEPGWSIEARFAVEWPADCATSAVELGGADDQRAVYVMRRRGVLFVEDSTYAVAEDGDQHLYRLESRGGRVRVFYDGQLAIDRPAPAAQTASWAPAVAFGTMSYCTAQGGVRSTWSRLTIETAADARLGCQEAFNRGFRDVWDAASSLRWADAARLLRATIDSQAQTCPADILDYYRGQARRHEALAAAWSRLRDDVSHAAPELVRELLAGYPRNGLSANELHAVWRALYERDGALRDRARELFPARLAVRWPADLGAADVFVAAVTRRAGPLSLPIAEQGTPRATLDCAGVATSSEPGWTRTAVDVLLRRGQSTVLSFTAERGGGFIPGSSADLHRTVAEQMAEWVVDDVIAGLLRRQYLGGGARAP